MAYEVESIDSSPTPQIQAPVMREERMVNPYQSRMPKTPLPSQEAQAPAQATQTPPIGQDDKVKGIEEPKPTEDTVKLSPQVAALARKEQKFRQQMLELEKEKAAIAAEKAEIAQLRAMKEKLAAKDYSALEGMVDYNEYSQYQLNKLNGTDPVQEEFKKLNGKISEIEKRTEENINKQFEAAVAERRIATQKLVDSSDAFPRIKKAKAHEAVVQHILDTWEHDSEELSIEQAAKEVEEVLVEKAKQWAALLEEEKKVAAEIAPSEGEKKSLPPLKPSLKTLTNQVTAGELKRPARSYQGMSDQERWAEARRRAEEKLQKQ